MKVLCSWLDEFVDAGLSPKEIGEALTTAGVEVSSCRYLGDGLEDVVVARILTLGPHPNADKLSLCRVSDGSREYPVVCGAKNMKAGDTVALARVGARLRNGMEIGKAKIRGQVSEGMLCSEQELGISEEAAGILILPPDSRPGTPLAPAVGMDDWVLTIEITPNRGDCLSVLGVAREVAAITGAKVVPPDAAVKEDGPPAAGIAQVAVTDRDLCRRYSARVITDVTIAPSPRLIQRRLALCGIRPINNIVDITNYLLLEVGQPMHAFDLDRLAGCRIDVRRSGVVRRFTTLDGVSREILPEMLLIWDGEGPVAVAGVMGGENTEVLPSTRRILFESAHFAPASIRATGRRLGLSTESSYRFERGVDPSGTLYAVDRAVSLLAGFSRFTTTAGSFDVRGDDVSARTVPFRPARVTRIIGRTCPERECANIFGRLGFGVADGGEAEWQVRVPAHRFDVEREIDLIEEIARLSGYDNIPCTYPESGAPEFSPDDRFHAETERISEFLQMEGFSQAINYSFISGKECSRYADLLDFHPSDAMRLANPISDDATIMRPSLLMGLLHNVETNVRRFHDDIRIFEIGKAFGESLAETHFEEDRLAFVMTGRRMPGTWSAGKEPVDFFDAKGIAESVLRLLESGPVHFVPPVSRPFLESGKAAEIWKEGETIGWVGAVHRRLLAALEIPEGTFYGEIRIRRAASAPRAVQLRSIPRFPPVFRDVACIFPDAVPVGDVLAMIRELSPEIREATVFDVFTGEKIGAGRKSVAIRVLIQAEDRTLTEGEVHSIHTKVVKLLENRFGGAIRGS